MTSLKRKIRKLMARAPWDYTEADRRLIAEILDSFDERISRLETNTNPHRNSPGYLGEL
jgi:hypothetical protein